MLKDKIERPVENVEVKILVLPIVAESGVFNKNYLLNLINVNAITGTKTQPSNKQGNT